MIEQMTIQGRGVAKGVAEGEALVADTTLSFWGEVDAMTGNVIAVGHPLEGKSLKGRVLIIRSTKGSSGTPIIMRLARLEGNAPAALVNTELDSMAVLGCIVNGIPMITDLNRDPFQLVATGDWVSVNGNEGFLVVKKNDE